LRVKFFPFFSLLVRGWQSNQSINRPSIPPTQKTQCVAWSGLEKPKQTAAAGAGGGGAVVLLGG